MPVRHDNSARRWVDMELVVPGTPEQVWHAMATGNGNSGWFTKTKIEERSGGELVFDFGPNALSRGEVLVWDAPHRFSYTEREWCPGAPEVNTDIVITPETSDTCHMKMTHWLPTTDPSWDVHLEGFEEGWQAFFCVLRVYLTHFAGMKSASFVAMAPSPLPLADTWGRLTAALGIDGATVGAACTTADPPETLTGVVDRVLQEAKYRSALLRLSSPTPGIALFSSYRMDEGTRLNLSFFYYGDAASAQVEQAMPRWQHWLDTTFAQG